MIYCPKRKKYVTQENTCIKKKCRLYRKGIDSCLYGIRAIPHNQEVSDTMKDDLTLSGLPGMRESDYNF